MPGSLLGLLSLLMAYFGYRQLGYLLSSKHLQENLNCSPMFRYFHQGPTKLLRPEISYLQQTRYDEVFRGLFELLCSAQP